MVARILPSTESAAEKRTAVPGKMWNSRGVAGVIFFIS